VQSPLLGGLLRASAGAELGLERETVGNAGGHSVAR